MGRIWIKGSDISYYGQIKYIEDYKREPLIVLEHYQLLSEDGDVVFDNTYDEKRSVMLNLSQFDRVEMAEN